MPVMYVEEVRNAKLLRRFDHCAAVKAEALPIVAVFASLHSVKPLAIEELRTVEEVELHAVANAAIQHGHEAVIAMEWNGDAGNGDATFRHVLLHLAVVRQVHRHLMSPAREFARQCSDNIGQSACLREWHAFGGRIRNMHSCSAPLRCC